MVAMYIDLMKKYIPDIDQDGARLLSSYWRAFWDNPEEFEGTDMKEIITDWLKKELATRVRDERGALIKK